MGKGGGASFVNPSLPKMTIQSFLILLPGVMGSSLTTSTRAFLFMRLAKKDAVFTVIIELFVIQISTVE